MDGTDLVHTHGGSVPTEVRTLSWATEVEERGAGEILLTSMDHDGTKDGFAIDLTSLVSSNVGIPVIASGGGGSKQHFTDIFTQGKASAGYSVLAKSL